MQSLNLLNAYTNNSEHCVKQILSGLMYIFTSIHSCSWWFWFFFFVSFFNEVK